MSHVKERGQQVSIMGDIYNTARLVIIWLGTETSPENAALDHLASLQEIRQQEVSGDMELAVRILQGTPQQVFNVPCSALARAICFLGARQGQAVMIFGTC